MQACCDNVVIFDLMRKRKKEGKKVKRNENLELIYVILKKIDFSILKRKIRLNDVHGNECIKSRTSKYVMFH